jgi:hypothetical protein
MVILVGSTLFATAARASPVLHGSTPGAQPGVVRTLSATPSVRGSWLVSLGGTYGWEPDVLVEGDTRQLTLARLSVGYAPWEFLQLALSIDTSVHGYAWPEATGDTIVVGSLGDPRVSVRTGWELGAGVSLGALVDVWFPSGAGSFNIEGNSISPAAVLLFSVTPQRVPIAFHLNIGYRHDRSIHMVGDVASLTREQLLLSGATSAAHSLDVALAFEGRIGPAALYLEALGALTVGDGVEHSAAVIGVGSRFYLGPEDAVQLLVGMDFEVARADAAPDPATATVWRSPPLLNVHAGAAFRLPVRARSAGASACDETPPPPPETPRPGRIAGTVRCGTAACGPTARVNISGTDVSDLAPRIDSGDFVSAELPSGAYTLEASAQGMLAQRQQVEVAAGETARVEFSLAGAVTSEATGIRGRVSDFQAQPVQAATIRIPALGLELSSGADGSFEADAAPGEYEIIVSARGFGTQHTRITVPEEGTVVMNIELRPR